MNPDLFPHTPVKLSQQISFHCKRCGDCCRHVENSVMVESLDVYRMARYFREIGHPIQTIDKILTAYTEAVPLAAPAYPVFIMKTTGPEQSCIFLKDNLCSIQPVKTRTCRLYPFSAGPGDKSKPFTYYCCLNHAHHFEGSQISVNDWFHENFTKEDKEFVAGEFIMAAKLGGVLYRLKGQEERVLMHVLYYRYFNFDLDAPFLPQYHSNNRSLLRVLQKLTA